MSKVRKPGDAIGPWTVLALLGRGGSGEVWRATGEPGEVAVKILHPQLNDPDQARYQRFRHEIEMLERLGRRPGVVPLLSHSFPDKPLPTDPAWFAMPLATNIREALGESPTLAQVAEAMASVAGILAGLHREGVSHRDVKPGNLYQFEGQWAVGDFGLADFPGKDPITETGEQVGPRHYLAPEMVRDAKGSDGRPADVYSLAKTLWVLATRQSYPPPGQQLVAHEQFTIAGMTGHLRANYLDRLIERATDPDHRRRPVMAEVADELRAWLAPPRTPTGPTDLSDLAAEIRTVIEPVVRAEQIRNSFVLAASRAVDSATAHLRGIAEALAMVPGASRSLVDTSDYPLLEPTDGRRSVWDTARGCKLTQLEPHRKHLWLGVRFALYESAGLDGRLRFIAAHVLSGAGLWPAVLWKDERWALVGSAQQEVALNELLTALTTKLRWALECYTMFLKNPYPTYPRPFPEEPG